MSTTMFFLVPIGMLAVVWSLCFVGACFQTSGLPGPAYSDDILANAVQTGLIAYWPLNDLIGPQLSEQLNMAGPTAFQAQDLSGSGHTGTYVIPFAYPPPTAMQPSAQITNPSVQRGASIVPGDAGSAKNPLAASADFGGGYVSIPWSTQSSPQLPEFTFEAWIKPTWTVSGLDWAVFSAFINNTGFRIIINGQNQLEFVIGTGPGNMTNSVQPMVQVDVGSITYVAVTCAKNGIMQLWINPTQADTPNPPPAAAVWTSPKSTGYFAADPSQLTAIFIGAGDNEDAQTLRTQDGGGGAPLYPFQGQIQSVALYGSVLGPDTIQEHFNNGSG